MNDKEKDPESVQADSKYSIAGRTNTPLEKADFIDSAEDAIVVEKNVIITDSPKSGDDDMEVCSMVVNPNMLRSRKLFTKAQRRLIVQRREITLVSKTKFWKNRAERMTNFCHQ